MNVIITINANDLSRIATIPGNFKKGIQRGLTLAMLFAEAQSKLRFNTPDNLHVRTGHLRRSIGSGVEGNTGWIGTNVEYGEIHETGATIRRKTKNGIREYIMPKRPFIRPAVEENVSKLGDIIMKTLMEDL